MNAVTYEKRTDIHRRGAIQPKFYKFVGWYYMAHELDGRGNLRPSRSVGRASTMLEAFRRSEEAWDFGAIVYGDFGQCAVCGAHFATGEVWQHDETKDMIHIGYDCAHKYGMLSGTDWDALDDERRRKGLALKTEHENRQARERIMAEHPAFIDAMWLADYSDFIKCMGWLFLGQARDLTARQIEATIEASKTTAERVLRKLAADKARAERQNLLVHVGEEKKRLTWDGVKLTFFTTYETAYGVTRVLKFEGTQDGAPFVLVWKATSTELSRSDVGKVYNVLGTVKTHGDYHGEKQTIITRCKVTEVTS